MGEVDVYRVGLLSALWHDWRMITVVRRRPVYVRRCLAYLRYQVARRNWRAVKNTFNGYLAEPSDPALHWTRCGTGWTRRRARLSLAKHLAGMR